VYESAVSAPRRKKDPSPRDPAALLARLRLECICIDDTGAVELLYEGDGALFTARIEGGKVRSAAIDTGRGPRRG
jgi:hypothetical protein